MTRQHLPALAALATLTLAAAHSAQAQTFYTDRNSFNSNTTSLTTLNFEGLNTSSSTSAGLTVGGVNFVGYSTGYGYETYVLPASYSGGQYSLNGTGTLLGGRASLTTTLPGNTSAFGMDVGQSNTGGAISATLTVNLSGGGSYARTLNFTPGSSQFIGFRNTTNITSFVISRSETGLPPYPDVVDNLSFGLNDPVPTTSGLDVTLDTPTATVYPGGTFTFTGTVSNKTTSGAATVTSGFSNPFRATPIGATPIYAASSTTLNSGATTGNIPLFSVQVPAGTLPGTYSGDFDLSGTQYKSNYGVLGASYFAIIVPAPEPSQWVALAIGALGLGALTLRARRRAA